MPRELKSSGAPSRGAIRIAHFALGRTNPEAADGIDKTVYHLSRAQAEMGHSVRLFSITNKPPIPIPGVCVSAYPAILPSPLLFTRRLRDLLAWRSPFNLPASLIADLLAWQPDILHLHGVHIAQNVVLGIRASRAGIAYCVTVNGMLARSAQRRHRWIKRAAATVERRFLDRAAFLHAVSQGEVEDLRAYGTRATIVVAPNAIDPDSMALSAPLGQAAAPGSGSRAEPLEFVFLGRLDPDQKGLDLLLEGFAQAGLAEANLRLIGPSWRESQTSLELLAGRLGVAPQIRFSGPAYGRDKIDLLARASVFVHTSRWEGLPFSVLEAASLSRPCLLTPAADPMGSFARAEAAIVVEPTSEAIASGMRRFARLTPAERREMGRRARALVEREFSWPPTARTVIDAYRAHALEQTRP